MKIRSILSFVASMVVMGCSGQADGVTGGGTTDGDSGTALRDSGGSTATTEAGASVFGSAAGDAGPASLIAPASGSGSFTVMSDRPIAGSSTGASYHLEASFNAGTAACGTTTAGACSVNPCYGGASGELPVPNVGEIQFVGGQLAAYALEPTSEGNYTTLTVQANVPWATSGENVGVVWAHAPQDSTQPGGSFQLVSPPYVALSAGSALAGGVLSRQQDLELVWTSDSAASAVDQVFVEVTVGSTEVSCVFHAADGSGTVPAAALQALESGTGTYDVHSRERSSVQLQGLSGTAWQVGFNVDAHARLESGLAYGAVMIE